MTTLSRAALLGVSVATMAAVSQSDAATTVSRIGVAAAIANQVTGGVGGGAAKPVASGNDVFQDETLKTGDKANAQLLFIDETTLSVGPNSEVKLDRFVYDPNRRTGDVVLETGRGVFRFVSGNADPRGYQVKTPVATIGFRGTVVDFGYINGMAFAAGVQGQFFVTTASGVLDLGPGQAVIYHRDGTFEVVNFADFLIKVGGGTPYPLFGFQFLNDPDLTSFPDKAQQFADEAGSRNVPPAPPVGCSCTVGGATNNLILAPSWGKPGK